MAKKIFCIGIYLAVSFALWASVSAYISVGRTESFGYTGFAGTDTLTRRQAADARVGMSFSDNFSAYLSIGTDYTEELKSFSSFSSLANSLSMRYGLGAQYNKNLFACDVRAGLRILDMSFDLLNKYAYVFVGFDLSLISISTPNLMVLFDIPIQFSFNGYGSNFDIGTGLSLIYRVGRRGSQ